VQYRGCTDPRTGKKTSVTRTNGEARARITKLREDIGKNVRVFETMMREESDCPNFSETKGDRGWVRRGEFAREFDDVAFRLRVGEISQPVDTRDGFYLILRKG
jgi:parvulin-like peptidyl-prolyl isomerase